MLFPTDVWRWCVLPAGMEVTVSLQTCLGLSNTQLLSLKCVSCIFEMVLPLCSSKFKERAFFIHCITTSTSLPHKTSCPLSTHTGVSTISSPGTVQSLVGSFLCQPQQWLFLVFLFLRAHLKKCLLQSVWRWQVNSWLLINAGRDRRAAQDQKHFFFFATNPSLSPPTSSLYPSNLSV